MAQLVQPKSGYDVLAEGLTADGRVVRRVEARADNLLDVTAAFQLAGAEAQKAHLPVARIRLTASRGGVAEVALTLEDPARQVGSVISSPLTQSALLDGRSKVDAPPTVLPNLDFHPDPLRPLRSVGVDGSKVRWTVVEILDEADRQAPDLGPFRAWDDRLVANNKRFVYLSALLGEKGEWRQYNTFTLEEVVRRRLRLLRASEMLSQP